MLQQFSFVVALLNDLFGIQRRSGRSCAGPYGHKLLDNDSRKSDSLIAEIHRTGEATKPGWVRVSLG